MTDFRSVWVVMSLAALAFAGCKPKIDPLSSATQEMPEGKACGPDGVISDGENSPNQVNVVKGRGGYWYTFADDGSNITPMTGKKGGTFAMEHRLRRYGHELRGPEGPVRRLGLPGYLVLG